MERKRAHRLSEHAVDLAPLVLALLVVFLLLFLWG
jgi:hypothetical protein